MISCIDLKRCLESAGILYVDELMDQTDEDLLEIRNLSEKCLKEIRQAVNNIEGKHNLKELDKPLPRDIEGYRRNYASKKKGETRVDPFLCFSDIEKLINWFKDNKQYDNYLITIFGLFMGRKIGEILSIKWSDLYEENGTLKQCILIGANNRIVISKVVEDAIRYYVTKTHINPLEKYDDFIIECPNKTEWKNRKNNQIYDKNDLEVWCRYFDKDFSEKRKEKIISNFNKQDKYTTLGSYLYNHVEWLDIIKWQSDTYRRKFKTAVTDIGIKYNVSTDSLRKTFGCISIMIHPKDIDSLDVLRDIFEHPDLKRTQEYIGLDEKRKQQYYLDMGEIFNLWEERNKKICKGDEIIISISKLRNIMNAVLEESQGDKEEVISRVVQSILDTNDYV